MSGVELKKGAAIELDGDLYQVLDYQHIKMGRGSAQLRLKLRHIRSRHTIEQTFPASEKFTLAQLDHRYMQYLYNDGSLYYFMDEKNFEQLPISAELLGSAVNYLKEGISVEVFSYKDEPVGVEMPVTVELEVVETGPAFKGDTATTATKPAKLETGITIQVPMFINQGDTVKVDTRPGTYIERVS